MANQKLFEVTSGDGTSIYIEYNDANLRIGRMYLTVPSGVQVNIRIWDEGELVWNEIYQPGSYDEVVPGNYWVTEYVDPEDEEIYAYLPQEIAWSYSEVPLI